MIARSIAFLTLLGAALATYKPFEGVDPNSLSCDDDGKIFLLLPDFEDCNKFYMCAHGKEIEFKCSKGLIFDFEWQSCQWPWFGVCKLRTGDIEGSGDSEELWIPLSDVAPLGVVDILNKADDLKFNSVLNCNSADSASRQVAYKGDCQRYWRCENGVPQAAYCSDGLYFNARTQQCDFEANSKCVDNHPNELGGEFIEYK